MEKRQMTVWGCSLREWKGHGAKQDRRIARLTRIADRHSAAGRVIHPDRQAYSRYKNRE